MKGSQDNVGQKAPQPSPSNRTLADRESNPGTREAPVAPNTAFARQQWRLRLARALQAAFQVTF